MAKAYVNQPAPPSNSGGGSGAIYRNGISVLSTDKVDLINGELVLGYDPDSSNSIYDTLLDPNIGESDVRYYSGWRAYGTRLPSSLNKGKGLKSLTVSIKRLSSYYDDYVMKIANRTKGKELVNITRPLSELSTAYQDITYDLSSYNIKWDEEDVIDISFHPGSSNSNCRFQVEHTSAAGYTRLYDTSYYEGSEDPTHNWDTEYADEAFKMKIEVSSDALSGSAIVDISETFVKYVDVMFQKATPSDSTVSVDVVDQNDSVLMSNVQSGDDISSVTMDSAESVRLKVTLTRSVLTDVPKFSNLIWGYIGVANAVQSVDSKKYLPVFEKAFVEAPTRPVPAFYHADYYSTRMETLSDFQVSSYDGQLNRRFCYSEDGVYIYYIGYARRLFRMNTLTGEIIHTDQLSSYIYSDGSLPIWIQVIGDILYLNIESTNGDYSIQLFNTNTLEFIKTLFTKNDQQYWVNGIEEFNGKLYVGITDNTSGYSSRVYRFDMVDGVPDESSIVSLVNNSHSGRYSSAFSIDRDNNKLYYLSGSGDLKEIDLNTLDVDVIMSSGYINKEAPADGPMQLISSGKALLVLTGAGIIKVNKEYRSTGNPNYVIGNVFSPDTGELLDMAAKFKAKDGKEYIATVKSFVSFSSSNNNDSYTEYNIFDEDGKCLFRHAEVTASGANQLSYDPYEDTVVFGSGSSITVGCKLTNVLIGYDQV